MWHVMVPDTLPEVVHRVWQRSLHRDVSTHRLILSLSLRYQHLHYKIQSTAGQALDTLYNNLIQTAGTKLVPNNIHLRYQMKFMLTCKNVKTESDAWEPHQTDTRSTACIIS